MVAVEIVIFSGLGGQTPTEVPRGDMGTHPEITQKRLCDISLFYRGLLGVPGWLSGPGGSCLGRGGMECSALLNDVSFSLSGWHYDDMVWSIRQIFVDARIHLVLPRELLGWENSAWAPYKPLAEEVIVASENATLDYDVASESTVHWGAPAPERKGCTCATAQSNTVHWGAPAPIWKGCYMGNSPE